MEYSTVILGGGESRRMGQDKRKLDWFGKPLLFQRVEAFTACQDLMLSLRMPEVTDLPRPVRFVYDAQPDAGPMAGVSAALTAMENEVLFVTGCDTPLVDTGTAEYLLSMLGNHDAVVPVSEEGRVHPLTAVYRRCAAEKAVKLMAEGRRKMTELLKELDVVFVPGKLLPGGELTLSNLNTPEDVAHLKEMLRREEP